MALETPRRLESSRSACILKSARSKNCWIPRHPLVLVQSQSKIRRNRPAHRLQTLQLRNGTHRRSQTRSQSRQASEEWTYPLLRKSLANSIRRLWRPRLILSLIVRQKIRIHQDRQRRRLPKIKWLRTKIRSKIIILLQRRPKPPQIRQHRQRPQQPLLQLQKQRTRLKNLMSPRIKQTSKINQLIIHQRKLFKKKNRKKTIPSIYEMLFP